MPRRIRCRRAGQRGRAGLLLRCLLALSVLVATGGAVRAGPPTLEKPAGPVLLTVTGAITQANADDGEALFDRAMLRDLPQHTLKTSTVVTDGVQTFEGFRMRDLLDRVGADGTTATAIALNDYVIDIPVSDFERYDVLVAMRMNGRKLVPSGKGPLWIVYPRDQNGTLQDIRYDYRWVWQLIELDIH